MSFFDEADEPRTTTTRSPRPRRPSGGGGGGGDRSSGRPDDQSLLIRRAIAAGAGLIILILIVVGIKGCLDSRKKDALRSYNNSVGQIVTESAQTVSPGFFGALQSANGQPVNQVATTIDGQLNTAQQEVSSAKALSVPSEMAGAQQNLLLTLDLRVEGIQKVAQNITAALGGGSGAQQAIKTIAGDMQMFLASDVIYETRVAPLISQALTDNGVGGQTIASSQFLPSLQWLNPTYVSTTLTGSAGSSGSGSSQAAQPGLHGDGLNSVAVGSQTLSPGTTVNDITLTPGLTFTLSVANQGQYDESNVGVTVKLEGGGSPITGSAQISKIAAGATQTVDVPLSQAPPTGTPLKLTASVNGVPGEKNLSNNTLTYIVTFH